MPLRWSILWSWMITSTGSELYRHRTEGWLPGVWLSWSRIVQRCVEPLYPQRVTNIARQARIQALQSKDAPFLIPNHTEFVWYLGRNQSSQVPPQRLACGFHQSRQSRRKHLHCAVFFIWFLNMSTMAHHCLHSPKGHVNEPAINRTPRWSKSVAVSISHRQQSI